MRLSVLSLIFFGILFSACTKATLNWAPLTSYYRLTFLNYSKAQTITLEQFLTVQVAVQNTLFETVTSANYTISLGLYTDASCTVAANFSGSSNALGVATATQNGVANISLSGMSNGASLQLGTPYYIKASASGLTSSCSSPLTFSKVNLIVPIEMLDLTATGPISSTTPYTRSETTLDTNDYDGAVSYAFEIVATNNSSTGSASVILENTTATTQFVSIPIPISSLPTRFNVPFTPATGLNTYRVKLIGGTTGGNLSVSAARMIVQQTGATKTKIYIPLMNGSTTGAADTVGVVTSSSLSYGPNQNVGYQTIWKYDSSAYSTLGASPFSLEVVASTTSGTVHVALYDIDAAAYVPASEITSTMTTPTRIPAVSFAKSNLVDGHRYQLSYYGGGANFVIYRAGLWVQVPSVISAEIYNRIGTNFGVVNGLNAQYGEHRISLDASKYSNPSFYLESTSNYSGTSGTVEVGDCGSNDSGGGCIQTGNTVTLANFASRVRGSNSFQITNGNRYIFIGNGVTSITNSGSFIVVKISE